METLKSFYAHDRISWRKWLEENFEKEKEIWLVFPKKGSGEIGISYNDAVEESLCFGWIDSTVKTLDENHRIQRFSPRKKGSPYSRSNIERLIWLEARGLLHPKVRASVIGMLDEPYVFPEDIVEYIRSDKKAWENFEKFTPAYKRIRVAYIDGARNRPAEFKRRLENFIRKTRENKLVGYGGIDKYYE